MVKKLNILLIILFVILKFNSVNSYWWYLGLKSFYYNKQLNNSFDNITTIEDNNQNNNKTTTIITTKYLRKSYCNDANILTSLVQRRLCNTNTKVIQIISDSAAMAMQECQFQFKYRRWNCTIFNTTNVYGRVLTTKSRETAFIHAINSAAVMYRVTQACSKGELDKCGCDKTILKKKSNDDFEWGGCSHNVFFGHKFSRKFVDSSVMIELRKKNNVEDRLMNLHNNEVGRRTILKNMKQMCKCHGVSGSCSMKICWQVMPDFRVIGDNLIKSFNDALQVNMDKQTIGLKVKKTRSTPLKEKPRKDDLVYVFKSPNFCEKNPKLGSLGTKGRKCILLPKTYLNSYNYNTTRDQTNESCSHLCCGRGYRTKIVDIEEDCNCQFQWCCQVKCKKCKKRIIEYYCN